MNKKLLIGLTIATATTALLTFGVIRELRAIRALTIDADDLTDEFAEEDLNFADEDEEA